MAAASVMDNNELALGLQEPDLEKVTDPGEAMCWHPPASSVAKPRKSRAQAGFPSEALQHLVKMW